MDSTAKLLSQMFRAPPTCLFIPRCLSPQSTLFLRLLPIPIPWAWWDRPLTRALKPLSRAHLLKQAPVFRPEAANGHQQAVSLAIFVATNLPVLRTAVTTRRKRMTLITRGSIAGCVMWDVRECGILGGTSR